jgi:2,4-dienoyl-CoA reductase (NADPH2)
MKLIKLFEPGFIKRLELKNRLAMPATCTQQAKDGFVTEQVLDFYEARAKGGAGLLVVGYINVDPEPCIDDPGESVEEYRKKWVDGPVLNLYDDKFMPGLQKLVDLIHRYDVKVGAHFNSISTKFGGSEGLRRDALFRSGPFRRLNTAGRLREIVEYTALAAGRAKAIGFDLIEFGASGEALLGQTLSHHPRRNPQIKGYCEGREGKLRFALEMIKETREVIGLECPLGIRILAHEYMEGGYDLEESKIYAQRLEEAGLDFINVAVAPHSATVPQLPLTVPPGAFRYLNKGIKEVVNIPVFASVRINDVTLGERILRNEEADFINMCRPILADPELPNKAREGRFEENADVSVR